MSTASSGVAATISQPPTMSTGISASVVAMPNRVEMRPVANTAVTIASEFTARSIPAQICVRTSRSKTASSFLSSKYTKVFMIT